MVTAVRFNDKENVCADMCNTCYTDHQIVMMEMNLVALTSQIKHLNSV